MTRTFAIPRKAFLGFDHIFDELERISTHANDSYPPHNVVKMEEHKYTVELAVAGFGKSEIDIELQEGLLSIRGKIDSVDNTEYLYKGIAERGFKREFTLADNVEVKSSTLVNGMLKIWLEAFIPEEKKARTIEIGELKKTEKKQFLSE